MGAFDDIASPVERRVILALADMDRFARLARTMRDREVFDMLDGFYEVVTAAVEAGGGRVIKFMGDGALIAFPDDDPPGAVGALRDMKARSEQWLSRFDPGCRLSVKAHIGVAVCGPMGQPGRKQLDVVGRAVMELFMSPFRDFALSPELNAALGGKASA